MSTAIAINPDFLNADRSLNHDAVERLVAEMNEVTRQLVPQEDGGLGLPPSRALADNRVATMLPEARKIVAQMVGEGYLRYRPDGNVEFGERAGVTFRIDGPTVRAIGIVLIVGGILVAVLAALLVLVALIPPAFPWFVVVGIVLFVLGLIMIVIGAAVIREFGDSGVEISIRPGRPGGPPQFDLKRP